VTRPTFNNCILLNSITSTELLRVIFSVGRMENWRIFARKMEGWHSIDKQLCRLVDRLRSTGYRHTLEVELRPVEIGGDFGECDFTKLLPEFRENGIVIVTDGERVLHSSTRDR